MAAILSQPQCVDIVSELIVCVMVLYIYHSFIYLILSVILSVTFQ